MSDSTWFRDEHEHEDDESTEIVVRDIIDIGPVPVSMKDVSESANMPSGFKHITNEISSEGKIEAEAKLIAKIQSIFRGWKARARIQEAKSLYNKFVQNESELLTKETERIAATQIQAMLRGVYVRQMFRQYMGAVGPAAESVILQLKADNIRLENSLNASSNKVSALSAELSVSNESICALKLDKLQLTVSLAASNDHVHKLTSKLQTADDAIEALELAKVGAEQALLTSEGLAADCRSVMFALRASKQELERLLLEREAEMAQLKGQLKLSENKAARLFAVNQELSLSIDHFGAEQTTITTALGECRNLAGFLESQLIHTLESLKLGCDYDEDGHWSEGEIVLNSLLAEREDTFGSTHHQTTAVLDLLGQVYEEQNKLKEAEDVHKKCLRLRNSVLGHNNKFTVLSLLSLAAVLVKQQRHTKAIMYYYRAFADCLIIYGDIHPRTLFVLDSCKVCLQELNKSTPQTPEDAEMYLRANLFGPSEVINRLFQHSTCCGCCASMFTTDNKEHHCTLCYKSICQACSPAKKLVPILHWEAVRLCVSCIEALRISPPLEEN